MTKEEQYKVDRYPQLVAEVDRLRAGLMKVGREARDGKTLAAVGLVLGMESADYKALLQEIADRQKACNCPLCRNK